MKTFAQIINDTRFDDVWLVLTGLYDNISEKKEAFERIFDLLNTAKPEVNYQNMSISICEADEPFWAEDEADDDGQPGYQAVGLVPGDEDYYSIGAKEPGQLAGLWVDDDSAKKYTPAQIAAYCMVEITYFYSVADMVWGKNGIVDAAACGGTESGSVTIDAYRREIGAVGNETKTGTERFF